MNVLWVTNLAIPQIAKDINAEIIPLGGWMVKLADEISSVETINLTIAFPFSSEIEGKVDNINYYGFSLKSGKNISQNIDQEKIQIKKILEKSLPDVIHIFGTEYRHSYVFAKVCQDLNINNKLVVSIQGLLTICAKHFDAYLPYRVIFGRTPRDFLKGSVADGRKKFLRGALLERETLRISSSVIGRTEWDQECTYLINPKRNYFFNNEMLRDSFYRSKKWNLNDCCEHRIFMSQSVLPYKGLHIAIEALHLLKSDFPDICLHIAGRNYATKKKWKLSYFECYIVNLIEKYGLTDNIKFMGILNEEEMCCEYLQAHVFVSASSIENSPNSVCEAMYLGTPVVSSLTGGIANLLEHENSGYLYQPDAPYMLAHYIRRVFDDNKKTLSISEEEIKRAETRHEPNRIISDLLGIYKEINGVNMIKNLE